MRDREREYREALMRKRKALRKAGRLPKTERRPRTVRKAKPIDDDPGRDYSSRALTADDIQETVGLFEQLWLESEGDAEARRGLELEYSRLFYGQSLRERMQET